MGGFGTASGWSALLRKRPGAAAAVGLGMLLALGAPCWLGESEDASDQNTPGELPRVPRVHSLEVESSGRDSAPSPIAADARRVPPSPESWGILPVSGLVDSAPLERWSRGVEAPAVLSTEAERVRTASAAAPDNRAARGAWLTGEVELPGDVEAAPSAARSADGHPVRR